MKFRVRVMRVIREDAFIEVDADNPVQAANLAMMDATSEDDANWECYDCEYFCDECDVKAINEAA